MDGVGEIGICFIDLKTLLTDIVRMTFFQGVHIFAFGNQMNFH
jgi:hypothetical protein